MPYDVNLSFPKTSWLDDIIFSKINLAPDVLTQDDRRLILIIWFYALFVETLMPTKPILAFIGEKGSGKTTTLRKIGKLLVGDGFNVVPLTNDPKDFDAAITNSALVVFDNADASFKWLDDKLAIAATGGSVQKRELYTTNKLIDFPIHAFIGITSRTPQYRRDDVADRLLIMKVERLDSYVAESQILAEVAEHRNEIMTEVVSHIQEMVGALKDHSREVKSVKFRMADFARFALTLAAYAGISPEMETILTRLSTEQTDYANEDDPLLELLLSWVCIGKNAGREVTTAQLCKELSDLAEREKIEFPYKGNVQSFGQKLSSSLTYLKTSLKISMRTAGKGAKKYVFRCLP